MEKINLVELLKDCPEGMELDCIMLEGSVVFEDISDDEEYPIGINLKNGDYTNLTKYGQYLNLEEAKCVIFPKGKTTWEGFVPPGRFKDGDVISNTLFNGVCIFRREGKIKGTVDFYCGINTNSTVYNELFIKDCKDPLEHFGNIIEYNFATEEEKEKLFKAIKDNGYRWNSENKTLEKLVELKFKDGDIIKDDHLDTICIFKGEGGYKGTVDFYCGINIADELYIKDIRNQYEHFGEINKYNFATEEEKQKLFQAIKDNGYRWNAETKTLEKLIQPEFKVGDKVRVKNGVSEPRIIDG